MARVVIPAVPFPPVDIVLRNRNNWYEGTYSWYIAALAASARGLPPPDRNSPEFQDRTLVPTSELARRLGVSHRTVVRWHLSDHPFDQRNMTAAE